MSSGNFAVVFKMRDSRNGDYYALKCFTREQDGRSKAYKEISKELSSIKSDYLISMRYLEFELFVDTSNSDETEFPVLLMDWVEGVTLDKYIQQYIGNSFELHDLCVEFAEMSKWLVSQHFAHGDLKPDNILVRPNGKIVLIDYDGMYTSSMRGQKAREIGSTNYRLPDRTIDDFNEHIDDFALAAISLSLKATSISYGILEKVGGQESFIFSENDYYNIKESAKFQTLTELMYDDCSIAPYISTFILALNHTVLVPNNFNFGDTHVSELLTRAQFFTRTDEPMDEVGVIYSYDGKRVLKFDYSVSEETDIHIKEGVVCICEEAFSTYKERKLHIFLPVSLRFFTRESFDYQYSELTWESPWFTYKDGFVYTKDFTGCILQHLVDARIDERVKIIETNCFSNLNNKGLVLPDGLLRIKKKAFLNSLMDEDLCFPQNVTIIEDSAFSSCKNLNRVFFNKKLQIIGQNCFSFSKDIEYVFFHEECDIQVIPCHAFHNCVNIKRISFSSRLRTIDDEAFQWCYSIDQLAFPESLIRIGKRAFNMKGFDYSKKEEDPCRLKEIILPTNLQSVGSAAFTGCKSLCRVNVTGESTVFEGSVFEDCHLLRLFDAKHLEKISDRMFSGCTELEIVRCPKISHIGKHAFEYCTSLTYTIPETVKIIETGALNCVKSVIASSNYIYQDNVLCDKDMKSIISFNKKDEKYTIPNGVTKVSKDAFGMEPPKYLKLPNSLSDESIIELLSLKCKYIQIPQGRTIDITDYFSHMHVEVGVNEFGEDSVFFDEEDVIYSADKVQLLKFPMSSVISSYEVIPSCKAILNNAFEGVEDCDPEFGMYYYGNKLKSLTLPEGLETIGDYSLEGCRELTSLVLPKTLKQIGNFALKGCHSLKSLTLPESLEILGNEALPRNLCNIYSKSPNFVVYNNCLLSTNNTLLWIPPVVTKLSLPNNITYRACDCITFDDCIVSVNGTLLWTIPDIDSFHFPGAIITIAKGAFANNKSIKELYVPYGVTTIEDGAFWCNQNLKSIWLPSTIIHIGDLRTYQGWGRKYIDFFYPYEIHVPKGMKRYFLDLLPGVPEKTLIDDYNE